MVTGVRPTGSSVARLATPSAALISLLAPVIVLAQAGLSHPALAATVSFLMVAAPIGVGIYAQRTESTRRFGRQLVLVGCGLLLTTFAYSESDALYTVGRISGWCMEVAILYVLCAYPTGRLNGRAARLIVAAGALIVALLYLPTAPFAEFPSPSPWTTCVDDCAVNALAGSREPAFVADFVQPLRSLLAIAVYVAAGLLLARRVRRAGPLAKTSLTPVLGVAVVRFGAAAAFVLLRSAGVANDAVLAPIAVAINLTIPLVAVGFLVGLLRWRLRVARALEALNERLGGARDARALQAALSGCLEDPSLRLFLPAAEDDGRWRGVEGVPLRPDLDAEDGRVLCPIEDGGRRVALISCDVAICEQRSLIDAIRAAVLSFLERERLASALQSTLAEIAASRTRIAAAADATRRQIERDLHDGTQQRLIALRIRLELTAAEMVESPERARAMLREIGPEVEAVITEVRDLSRGIYPPLLVEAGPVAAIEGVAVRLPVEARVVGGLGRREEEVEAVVYFCCAEAIQNAIKHGRDLSEITISFFERDGGTAFEVGDDGGGFEVERAAGSGITNMRDRLAAVGGTLSVESVAAGTRVRGMIPLRAELRAANGAYAVQA